MRTVAALGSVVLALLLAPAASAYTYTWTGDSGNWHSPAHWIGSAGAPGGSFPDGPDDDAVIDVPDDVTVTLNSRPGLGESSVFTIGKLTVGSADGMGSQELQIVTNGDTAVGSALTTTTASTVTPTGQVSISQDPSTPAGGSRPRLDLGADLANQGLIIAEMVAAGGSGTAIGGAGRLMNTGTLHVLDGQFETRALDNAGTIITNSGSTLLATAGVTMTGGSLLNNGVTALTGGTWTQNGGTLTGNPIEVRGAGLADSAGTGAFALTLSSTLAGTVPDGQTVTIAGETGIQPPGLTVARGGTLALQSTAAARQNPITVDGTLRVADRGEVTGGLVVNGGGALDVLPDARLLLGGTGLTQASHGTTSIGPGGELSLALGSGDLFTSDGTLNLGIASPTRFGRITGSAGDVALAGALNGILAAGYTPAIASTFRVIERPIRTSAVATVGGGFTFEPKAGELRYGAATQGPPPAPPEDTTPPELSDLSASRHRLELTTTEAGRARVVVARRKGGRKVRGRCVKPTRRNRRKRRCARRVAARSVTLAAAGPAAIKLPSLKAGRYTVRVTVTDAAGNRSAPARVGLRIRNKR